MLNYATALQMEYFINTIHVFRCAISNIELQYKFDINFINN